LIDTRGLWIGLLVGFSLGLTSFLHLLEGLAVLIPGCSLGLIHGLTFLSLIRSQLALFICSATGGVATINPGIGAFFDVVEIFAIKAHSSGHFGGHSATHARGANEQ
jgi:hypothetical protein